MAEASHAVVPEPLSRAVRHVLHAHYGPEDFPQAQRDVEALLLHLRTAMDDLKVSHAQYGPEDFPLLLHLRTAMDDLKVSQR